MLVRQFGMQEPRKTSTALNESDLVQQRKHKSTINLSSMRNIGQKTVEAGLSLFTVFTFEETGTLPSWNSAFRYEEISALRNVFGHPIMNKNSFLPVQSYGSRNERTPESWNSSLPPLILSLSWIDLQFLICPSSFDTANDTFDGNQSVEQSLSCMTLANITTNINSLSLIS